MKSILVFIALTLVAVSANPSISHRLSTELMIRNEIEKGIIENTIVILTCIQKAIDDMKININGAANALNAFKELIASNKASFRKCKEIGGEKPSIVDQVAQAQCILKLGDSFKKEVSDYVNKIIGYVQGIIGAPGQLIRCF